MMLTDLREIKKLLEIHPDDTSEDARLSFYVEYASAIIEEYLNRRDKLFKKSRVEYYSGTGTQKIPLRARPVFTTPTIQVAVSQTGFYGSSSGAFDSADDQLVYGTDFCVEVDDADSGTSRSGILVRMQAVWYKPWYRQTGYLSPFVGEAFGNVRVTYTAGYTYDDLPGNLRMACNLLVARLRYVMPLGLELGSEGYEERSIGISVQERDYMKSLCKPLLNGYRNWQF